jgi:NADP-dependent 3-hydroxy acid dehydrogenase YdfG
MSFIKTTVQTVAIVLLMPIVWLLYAISLLKKSRSPRTSSSSKEVKTVVITGGSSGIGEGLAKEYASSGWNVHIIGRNVERLQAVARHCESLQAEHESDNDSNERAVAFHRVDVTDAAEMRRCLESIDDKDSIDLIVANAGVSLGTLGPSLPVEEAMVRMDDINWRGTLNTLTPLVPRFRERGSGHVAVMSSLASYLVFPASTPYCVTKAAQRNYAEGLRQHLAPSGVSVSIICPGYVESPLTKQNRFKMMFLWRCADACAYMKRELDARAPLIAFPFIMHTLARLVHALPDDIARWLCARLAPASSATRMYKPT